MRLTLDFETSRNQQVNNSSHHPSFGIHQEWTADRQIAYLSPELEPQGTHIRLPVRPPQAHATSSALNTPAYVAFIQCLSRHSPPASAISGIDQGKPAPVVLFVPLIVVPWILTVNTPTTPTTPKMDYFELDFELDFDLDSDLSSSTGTGTPKMQQAGRQPCRGAKRVLAGVVEAWASRVIVR